MASSQKHPWVSWFAIAIVGLSTLVLAIRLMYVTVTAGGEKDYKDPVVSKKVVRGTIYDRNGRVLAIETATYNIAFHLSELNGRLDEACALVAPFLDMSPDQVKEQASHYTNYAMIKKGVGLSQADQLGDAVRNAGLGRAVDIIKVASRSYPASFHASQTIGFVDNLNEGLEGIEYEQNQLLKPDPQLGSPDTIYGDDITLTLDIDIQYLLDLELQRIGENDKPDYAVGIVLDAKTGDILALSSYPWYDTNDLSTSSETSRLNHAVNYLYEPGSVFKVFTLLSELDAGQADFATPFYCDGSFTFDGITIGCHEAHGTVTPREMIAKSCNGAVANWALQTDSSTFYKSLEKFGFNQAYDIGLPSRSRARIPDPSSWSLRSKATLAFGQELSVTGLHLAVAATTLANDGRLLSPHLILKRSKGTETGEIGPTLWKRQVEASEPVFKPSLAPEVLDYMKSATEKGGTATLAAVDGVEVSAKTGTAQLYNEATKSYRDGSVLASTIALAPTKDPRYIVYIAAGNPKGGTIWGANIAAPAVGRVLKGLVGQGKLENSLSPTF